MNYYTGKICDARVYNRVLTWEEISLSYYYERVNFWKWYKRLWFWTKETWRLLRGERRIRYGVPKVKREYALKKIGGDVK